MAKKDSLENHPAQPTERFILINQQEDAVVEQPGTFSVAFSEPFVINPGGEVTLSSAVLDTGQNSQGVFLFPDDLDLTLSLSYSAYDFNDPSPSQYALFFSVIAGTTTPAYEDVTITIPAGSYSGTDLAELITRLLTDLPEWYQRMDTSDARNVYWSKLPIFFNSDLIAADMVNCFVSNADQFVNADYLIRGDISGHLSDTMIGTSQMALQFDGSKFAWTALHRPCRADNGDVCCFIRNFQPAGSPTYNIVPFVSAINLYDLKPASFWQDTLGFNLAEMTIKPNLVETINTFPVAGMNISFETFQKTTTRGFIGISALTLADGNTPAGKYNSVTPDVNLPAAGHVTAVLTNDIVAITATNFPQYTSSGFFLVDIQLLPAKPNCITTGQSSLNASATISRVLTSTDGFSFNVDAITQVNTSTQPLVVSGARVRILNATTQQVYTDLGPRNSFMLKIVQ